MNVALTIAGSDSSGGAGIQADLKTFHQFGVFGTSAVVAITAQNTRGVHAVHGVPVHVVAAQLDALAEDMPPKAFKTGMLANAELVETVADAVTRHEFSNYVLDPVMVATSGHRLLDADAEDSVRSRLVPLSRIVTPNLEEARVLCEQRVETVEDMEHAGHLLVELGAGAALIKGGHLERETIVDVLVTPETSMTFTRARLHTTATHGTGCTLSAAVTASLACGQSLGVAVERALDFVHRAIGSAPVLGRGHGPLNHFEPSLVPDWSL